MLGALATELAVAVTIGNNDKLGGLPRTAVVIVILRMFTTTIQIQTQILTSVIQTTQQGAVQALEEEMAMVILAGEMDFYSVTVVMQKLLTYHSNNIKML